MNQRQELFNTVLKMHGYTSLNNFCIENKLQQANFSRRLKDENLKVDLLILFKLADILHEPIETMIMIFYPDEWAENRRNMED